MPPDITLTTVDSSLGAPAETQRLAAEADLAEALEMLGQLDEAEAAYDKAAELVRATTGEQFSTYWYVEARHARLLHMRGDRVHALARFDAMFKTATSELELSQRALDTVRALHDVRDQSYVWLVRSNVATLRGDEPAAGTWARLVHEANARYNAPANPGQTKRGH